MSLSPALNGRALCLAGCGTQQPSGDVLELLLASVLECHVEFAVYVLMDAARHTDPTRLGKLLQSCRDVDTIAENVLVLDDNLTDVNADTEIDTLVGGNAGIAPGSWLAARRPHNAPR
jgi:hypothetical protein